MVVALVEDGRIASERIDASARRLLRDKFRLGLFDEPRVDPGAAERVCGNDEFRAAGERMQRRSTVSPEERRRVTARGRRRGAGHPAQCSIREAHGNFIEALFHAGDLDFKEPELSELLALARTKPTVLVLHLDRPAVMPELVEACAGVVAVFGASDAAVDDVLRGRAKGRRSTSVRAAALDGGGAQPAAGRPARLRGSTLPDRIRARALTSKQRQRRPTSRDLRGFPGPDRDRTCDLGIKSPLLYQLSYRPSLRQCRWPWARQTTVSAPP